MSEASRILTAIENGDRQATERQTGPVYSASFSPDGSRVVTTSDDRSVTAWDTTPINRRVALANRPPAVVQNQEKPAGYFERPILGQQGYDAQKYAAAAKPSGQTVTAPDDRSGRRSGRIENANPISVAIDTIHSRICEILTPAYCQRQSVAHNGGVAHRVQRAHFARRDCPGARDLELDRKRKPQI